MQDQQIIPRPSSNIEDRIKIITEKECYTPGMDVNNRGFITNETENLVKGTLKVTSRLLKK